MLAIEEYEKLRVRPRGPHVMYQRWRSLLFLHFPCPASEIQALLPAGLEVDTYDGKAWVGLVLFRMEGIRPRFAFGVPGHSAFPETNVRTYAHREGREPGVWFFSLDAASGLACRVARMSYALPYFAARMNVREERDVRTYDSVRCMGGVESHVSATIGQPLQPLKPGSLEFFLVERYMLYAARGGRLLKGMVHHPAYPLREVLHFEARENLVQAGGISPRPFEHAIYSPGVDVDIFAIGRATAG
jgi:uncharacterized protein YqjF (DUF2071 family)